MHAALGRGGDLVRGRLFYGWYIALAGAFTSFLTFGVVGFGFGVFIEPIREETGWSLAAISVGFSLRSFEHGLLAPVTGALVDRLGARRMAIVGVLIVGVGLVLFSQARVLWVYYIASLVIASGESLGSSTAYSAALMRWFDQKRGQALGLLASARGAGYFMVPVLAVLIGAFGWRSTLLIAAVVIVGCALPLSLVLRNRPEPYGYRPDGAPAPATPTASQEASSFGDGMTVAEALRTPAFYLLGTATAIGAATQISWIVHQVPHLQNVGFTLQGAAFITGAYGLFQVPLRFICGWLGDIVGRRRLYVISYFLQCVGMLIFASLSPSRLWLLPLYFLTYPFAHAAWVAMFMTLVADYFGTRYFATIRGLTSTLMMPLGFAGPVIAGWAFDQTGSYRLVFTCYALFTLSGAIFLLLIRRPTWAQLPSR